MNPTRTARLAAAGLAAGCAVLAAGCHPQVDGEGTVAAGLAPGSATPSSSAALPSLTPSRSASPRTSPSAPAPGTVPVSFAGTWTGTIDQPSGVIPRWVATLVLVEGRAEGTLVIGPYCTGTTTVLTATQDQLVLREVISSDPTNRCAASGTITMRRTAPNRATMVWVDSDHADNVGRGVLVRR